MVSSSMDNDSLESLYTVLRTYQQQQRVVYAESGMAFKIALKHKDKPEVMDFLEKCMDGVVTICLEQKAPNVRANLLINFDYVLIGSAKIIAWDIKNNRRTLFLDTLSKLLNPDTSFFSTPDYDDTSKPSRGITTRAEIVKVIHDEAILSIIMDCLEGKIKLGHMNASDIAELSCEQVRHLLAPVVYAKDVIEASDVKKACYFAMHAIENMSNQVLKMQRSADFAKLHRYLKSCLEGDLRFKEFLRTLSLRTLDSKSFHLRKYGLELMCKLCAEASASKERSPEASGFTVSSMNKWFTANNILEKLFSSAESVHPALVGRCKKLLEFMAHGDAIERHHIDTIFKSCTGLHDSVRGAVLALLAEISVDCKVRADTSSYIYASAANLIPDHQNDAVLFVEKVMSFNNSVSHVGDYESPLALCKECVVESFLKLMWSLISNINDLTSIKRAMLIDYFIDVLAFGNALCLRANYITLFIGIIRDTQHYDTAESVHNCQRFNAYKICPKIISLCDSRTSSYSVATAVEAMSHRFKSIDIDDESLSEQPETADVVDANSLGLLFDADGYVRSQDSLIFQLEETYHILELVVSELQLFRTSQKYDPKTYSRDATLEYMMLLESRLSFLQFCVSRSQLALNFKLVCDIWKTLASPLERELCLLFFWQSATIDVGMNNGIVNATVQQIFSELLMNDNMDFEVMTLKSFNCFSAFFLEVNQAERIIETSITNYLVVNNLYEIIYRSVLEAFEEPSKSTTKAIGISSASPSQNTNSLDTLHVEHEIFTSTLNDGIHVLSPHVIGIDSLWRVIEAAPTKAATSAMYLLLQIQIGVEANSSANDQDSIGEAMFEESSDETNGALTCRKAFIDRCFELLETRKCLLIEKCVHMLQAYLKVFEHYGNISSHSEQQGSIVGFDVHHDKVLLYSNHDIGKCIALCFSPNLVSMSSVKQNGVIVGYNNHDKHHSIWLSDGKILSKHLRDLKSSSLTSLHMLGCDKTGKGELPFPIPVATEVPLLVEESLKQYKPMCMRVNVKRTVMALQAKVLDMLCDASEDLDMAMLDINTLSMRIPLLSKANDGHSADYGHERVLSPDHKLVEEVLPGESKGMRIETGHSGDVVYHALNVVVEKHAFGESKLPFNVDTKELPAVILTQIGSPYASRLETLLDEPHLSDKTRQELWSLLMNLPTDENLLTRLRGENGISRWERELCLDSNSLLNAVYKLTIVNRLLGNDEENSNDTLTSQEWRSGFLKSNGFDTICLLLDRVLHCDKDEDFPVWQRLVAFPLMIKVIRFCVEGLLIERQTPQAMAFSPASKKFLTASVDFSRVSHSLGILISVAHELASLDVEIQISNDGSLIKDNDSDCSSTSSLGVGACDEAENIEPVDNTSSVMLSVLVHALQTAVSIFEVHKNVCSVFLNTNRVNVPSKYTLTDVVMLSQFGTVRDLLSAILIRLSAQDTKLCEQIERMTVESLRKIPVNCSTADEFFLFVRRQIKDHYFRVETCISVVAERLCDYPAKDELQLRREMATLAKFQPTLRVVVYKPRQDDSMKPNPQPDSAQYAIARSTILSLVDSTLIGLLELMELLIRSESVDMQEFETLLHRIFSDYLMAVPGPHAAQHSSLATLPDIRSRCYSLLKTMADNHKPFHIWLSEKIQKFVESTPVPLTRHGLCDWNFKPVDFRKSPTGFVGLINQGATCYQNSILQQLFMSPELRSWISHAVGAPATLIQQDVIRYDSLGDEAVLTDDLFDDEDVTLYDNPENRLLRALQYSFTFLRHSDKKFFNPKHFVSSSVCLKLIDGHLSQNDAIEFYSRLVDYLEATSDMPQRKQLQDLLYVRTCTMNVRNCAGKHRTEREVGTPFLTLNVRSGVAGSTLHSLEEALESWFKAETLSGLECEVCNQSDKEKRFDADQIKCFSKLPPVLVVQLQRFDYDYEIMQPTKLNHRVSFEKRIDLSRFTRRAVVTQVNEDLNQQLNTAEEYDEDEPTISKTNAKMEMDTDSSESSESYIYELRGVVVHQGSGANFGHYYSFISDRKSGNWFRFDDERVTPFDIRNLEEECFGGIPCEDSPRRWNNPASNSYGRNANDNNAYLLLYERVKQDGSRPYANSVEQFKFGDQVSYRFGISNVAKLVVKLQRWLRKVRLVMAFRNHTQRLVEEVFEDNQRTHRHGIVMVPMFVDFVLSLLKLSPADIANSALISSSTRMGIVVALKVVTRVSYFKSMLERWQDDLAHLSITQPKIYLWLLEYLTLPTVRKEILEPFLLQCHEEKSSRFFDLMVSKCIVGCCELQKESVSPILVQFMSVMSDIIPKTLHNPENMDAYFEIFHTLCNQPVLHEHLRSLQFPARLMSFYVTNCEAAGMLDPHSGRSSQDEARSNAQLAVFDKLLNGLSLLIIERASTARLETRDELYQEDDFLEPWNIRSSLLPRFASGCAQTIPKDLLSGESIKLMARFNPGSGAQMIAFACKGDKSIWSEMLEVLFKSFKAKYNLVSYSKASVDVARVQVREVCRAIQAIGSIVDGFSFERSHKLVVEFILTIKYIHKEVDGLLSRRDARATRYSSPYYSDTETDDIVEILVYTVYALSKVLTNLFPIHAGVRAYVSHNAKHWADWLPAFLEKQSYSMYLGGNPDVYTRRISKGKVVRALINIAAQLGIPVPQRDLVPQYFVSVMVDGCGLTDCNGEYVFDGYFRPNASKHVDSVTPKFAKISGNRTYSLYRCEPKQGHYTWYISELSSKPGTSNDIDFYSSSPSYPTSMPPRTNWNICNSGVKPAPSFLEIRCVEMVAEDSPTLLYDEVTRMTEGKVHHKHGFVGTYSEDDRMSEPLEPHDPIDDDDAGSTCAEFDNDESIRDQSERDLSDDQSSVSSGA